MDKEKVVEDKEEEEDREPGPQAPGKRVRPKVVTAVATVYPMGSVVDDGVVVPSPVGEREHINLVQESLVSSVASNTRSKKGGSAKKKRKVPTQMETLVAIWTEVLEGHGAAGLLRLNCMPPCLDFPEGDPLQALHVKLRAALKSILGSDADPVDKICLGMTSIMEDDETPRSLWEKTRGDDVQAPSCELDASAMDLMDALKGLESGVLSAQVWLQPFSPLPRRFEVASDMEVEDAARMRVGDLALKMAREMNCATWLQEEARHYDRWRNALRVLYLNQRRRCGLNIPGGNDFIICVTGFSGDDPNMLTVTVSDRDSRMIKEGVLPLSTLAEGEKLSDWVSLILDGPYRCETYTKSKSSSMVQEAAKQARVAQKREKTMRVFGLQRDAGVFVLSNHMELHRGTGRLRRTTAPLGAELLQRKILPQRLLKERVIPMPDVGIRPWIDLWRAHFEDEHLIELLIILAHTSLCMAEDYERIILLIAGPPNVGKTEMMDFISLMLGFNGDELHLSGNVTNYALEERLHFLSGMPTFINDPDKPAQLDVIRQAMKHVYDVSLLAEARNKQRFANGFLCVSLNDGPLSRLLKREEVALWSRCVVLPVSACSTQKARLVKDLKRRNDLPSSAAVYRVLLAPLSAEDKKLPLPYRLRRVVSHDRVKSSLERLFNRVMYLLRVIKFGDKKKLALREKVWDFFRGPLAEATRDHQTSTAELGRQAARRFMTRICAEYFDDNGTFYDVNNTGHVTKKANGNYFVRLASIFSENEKEERELVRAGLIDLNLAQPDRTSGARGLEVKIDPSEW